MYVFIGYFLTWPAVYFNLIRLSILAEGGESRNLFNLPFPLSTISANRSAEPDPREELDLVVQRVFKPFCCRYAHVGIFNRWKYGAGCTGNRRMRCSTISVNIWGRRASLRFQRIDTIIRAPFFLFLFQKSRLISLLFFSMELEIKFGGDRCYSVWSNIKRNVSDSLIQSFKFNLR